MTTFKIYRGIAINENGSIQNENLGTSWTLDEIFAEDRSESFAKVDFRKEGVNRPIVMMAEVTDEMIDWPATLGQMNGQYFETEYEVILNGNTDIAFEVVQDEKADWLEVESLEGNYEGNTGSGTIDETHEAECDSDEIEELKARFIEVASEF